MFQIIDNIMHPKAFFFFITIFFSCIGISQVVPNAGFENWHNVGGWFDEPDYWETNNNSIMTPGVVRDSNAYQGILAMKVANVTNLPGYAYAGFPSTQHPLSIKVFAKSNILSSDSASIIVRVFYSGIAVDSGRWYCTTTIASWSLFTIPVSQNNLTADSIEIAVKAGAQIGTSISVDEFNCVVTGFNTTENNAMWSLFPNPINESSSLYFENANCEIRTLVEYNSLGEKVREIPNITGSVVKIEKGDLPQGIYLFELLSENKIVLKGKFFIE